MDSKSDKLWKKTIREQQRRIKPGECQKYVRLVIDSNVVSAPCGRRFIAELNNSAAAGNLKYEIRNLPLRETIIWERSKGQLALALNEANALTDEWQTEKEVVKLLTQFELQQLMRRGELPRLADDLQSRYAGMHCIVLYLPADTQKQSASECAALVELQVMHQLKVVELAPHIGAVVAELKRLTKAIAEAPYKQQKAEILETFKKFLANDKKQCVRVEGSNGFGRLWQQHLNRLSLVTLEVAETIIEKYPCPKRLIEELKNNENAVKDIGDLKIKRSGPVALQTDRRIGNVLSYKLYMLYNSKDPNTLI